MISIADFIKERKREKKKEKKKGYDYSKDINWDDCQHKRTKIFEVKPEWQIDIVSIVIECEGCTRIGLVDGSIEYDDEEVQWQNE